MKSVRKSCRGVMLGFALLCGTSAIAYQCGPDENGVVERYEYNMPNGCRIYMEMGCSGGQKYVNSMVNCPEYQEAPE